MTNILAHLKTAKVNTPKRNKDGITHPKQAIVQIAVPLDSEDQLEAFMELVEILDDKDPVEVTIRQIEGPQGELAFNHETTTEAREGV